MRRYDRHRTNISLIGLIFLLIIFSSILDFAGSLFFNLLDLVMLLAPLVMGGIFVAFLVKLISDAIKKKKGETTTAYTSVNTYQKTLMKKMSKYFENNQQINIDDETYLKVTDINNVDLDTVDIYMRDEYIGTLKDYYSAYPYAFNALANELAKYLNKKNSTKAETTTVAKQEEKAKEKEKTEIKKDSAYYIKQFSELQTSISNQQINDGLNETIAYLRQIKKTEDEFNDSKTKTVKLYQYYMPMLNDILANYIRLKKNGSDSAEAKASEDRLLKTIVLINGALKTISSSLVEDYYTEMNVDMRTLESILKKDGLVDEMKKENTNE